MKILFGILLSTAIVANAEAAKSPKTRVPASGSSLENIKAYYGSGKLIEIERYYQGSGKYQVLVTGASLNKKEDPGALLVSGVANGDYFTVIQELCNPSSLQPLSTADSERRFICFIK